jgi:predicted RNA-binding Zn ribbon-like protein
MGALHKVTPAPLEAVVDLVNGWSSTVLEAAGKSSPESGEGVVDDHGQPLVSSGQELRELADRLYRVFASDSPAARRAALNELILSAAPIPIVDHHGFGWVVADERKRGQAGLAFALWLHAESDPDLQRLGTCDRQNCADAFLDNTQARSRRYCSLTCQNRAKVAAFRRRHREHGDG